VNCSYTIPIVDYDAPKLPDCAMPKADRVAKAKQLFARPASADKPLTLAIESTNSDSPKKMAETIAVMWKQTLGVDAKVHARTATAGWPSSRPHLGRLQRRSRRRFRRPEATSYMDPRAEAGYNWPSPEFEATIDKALAVTTRPAATSCSPSREDPPRQLSDGAGCGRPNRHLCARPSRVGRQSAGLAFEPLDVDRGAVTWKRGAARWVPPLRLKPG